MVGKDDPLLDGKLLLTAWFHWLELMTQKGHINVTIIPWYWEEGWPHKGGLETRSPGKFPGHPILLNFCGPEDSHKEIMSKFRSTGAVMSFQIDAVTVISVILWMTQFYHSDTTQGLRLMGTFNSLVPELLALHTRLALLCPWLLAGKEKVVRLPTGSLQGKGTRTPEQCYHPRKRSPTCHPVHRLGI